MSTTSPQWAPADKKEHANDERAQEFAAQYPQRPIPTDQPFHTDPLITSPAFGLDELWKAIEPETRTRANDIHLPVVVAFATRLCDAYPQADRDIVLTAALLHDTGWAHVDESRIISEGFSGDWRKAAIRFEHEAEGVKVARRVLPGLGADEAFITAVCDIIDGHDTRHVPYSLEDALVRDADRLWRFDLAGISLSCSWFGMAASDYVARLEREILPELITEVAHAIANADLERSRQLLRTEVIR
ncbi:HD domain-containing protein [Corynebacterium lubricantis]|uniref:HD domain-containing protein n=1 Tax=Corynebacterium lubricantis TaxID=541095 RepID=UPI00036BAA51|nr:HD domain-containing protein [Corynebacterium lubricantis]